jgi:hypothetical protein
MLLPVIDWTLRRLSKETFDGAWSNPDAFAERGHDAETRIRESIRYFPSNILFVHRDCDTAAFEDRVQEIVVAGERVGPTCPIICIVPVKMTEAWFLFDEAAIRFAADRPDGRKRLYLPTHQEAQRQSDPKKTLEEALVTAAEVTGRRLQDFRRRIREKKHIVATRIEDFSPLKHHASYVAFEGHLKNVLEANNWT